MDIKTAILNAGVALLKEKGIAALTQPQVARAAGIKQSHLTYYFPKRTDLMLGIAEHAILGFLDELSVRLEHTAPPAAFAEALATAMVNGGPPRIMLGLIVVADSEPAVRPALCKLISLARQRLQKVLEISGIQGNEMTTTLFHAAVVGLTVMHNAQNTPKSARDLSEGIAGMLRLLAPELSAAVPRTAP